MQLAATACGIVANIFVKLSVNALRDPLQFIKSVTISLIIYITQFMFTYISHIFSD
jgi:hypothetical protein